VYGVLRHLGESCKEIEDPGANNNDPGRNPLGICVELMKHNSVVARLYLPSQLLVESTRQEAIHDSFLLLCIMIG
jgi:hypothetical protein